jgi:putative drug exporter of the RND superfamily
LFRNKFASLQNFNPACEKFVTSAGLVFAFTMLAMLTSELRTIGQIASTVCIGLLLDTLIVRSFVVPCIIRILGRWFWWPTLVVSRPLTQR